MKKDLVPLALLLAAVLVFFHPVIGGGKFYYHKDLMSYVFPLKHFWAESVVRGDFPLWMPHFYMGSPYLAQIDNGATYPLNVLYLAAAPHRAFGFIAVINYLLAAVSMYALARAWIGCRWASLVASLSFALGGYLVFMADNPLYLFSGALVPFAFLSLSRALERPPGDRGALGWTALLGLTGAIQLSGGDPQTVFYEFLFLGVFALMAPLSPGGRRVPWLNRRSAALMLRRTALVGAGALLAAGLMAVVLIPAVGLVRASARLEAISYADATDWSLSPSTLAELAVPYLFGLGRAGNLYLGGKPWVNCIFTGILALVLLPFGLGGLRRDRRIAFAALVLALALLLSLGAHTPVYPLFYKVVPLFSGFRYPIKAFVFVSFALSLLLGFAFRRVVTGDLPLRRGKGALAAAGVSLLLAGVLGAGIIYSKTPGALAQTAAALRRADVREDPTAVLASARGRALREVGYAAVFAVALAAVGIGARKGRALGAAGAALVLLHGADLLPVTREVDFFWTGAALHERIPGTVAAIQREESDAPIRIFSFDLLVNRHHDYDVALNPWEQQKIWDRNTLTSNHAVLYGLSYDKGYASLEPERFYAFRRGMDLADLPHYAIVLGIRYLVVPPLGAVPPGFLRRVETGEPGPFDMYLNVRAVPRAFLVPNVERVASPALALARIREPDFDPRASVVLEEPPASGASPAAAIPAEAVRYDRFLPDERILKFNAPGPMYLVEAESWFPGWRAEVDGRPAPLLRADYLMRCVPVPAGSHTVRLRYAPASFAWGRVVSFLSLALCAAAIVFGFFRRRRGPD